MLLDDNGVLRSRYRSNFKWIVDKVYQADKAWTGSLRRGEIKEGYFHSYSKVPINTLNTNPFFDVYSLKECIYECIIPEGTYYYTGTHSDGMEGYASKYLKIVKRIL